MLRNGDPPLGREIPAHLDAVAASLPPVVKRVYARADSGFYCREAIEAYEKKGRHYIVVARKTARLIEQLQTGTPATADFVGYIFSRRNEASTTQSQPGSTTSRRPAEKTYRMSIW